MPSDRWLLTQQVHRLRKPLQNSASKWTDPRSNLRREITNVQNATVAQGVADGMGPKRERYGHGCSLDSSVVHARTYYHCGQFIPVRLGT